MNVQTVEQKVFEQFNCSVQEVLQRFADQGLTSKQVSEQLGCGVSNVRRIARKYDIRFSQPHHQTPVTYSKEFFERTINATNFLSRPWVRTLKASVSKSRQRQRQPEMV